VVLEIDFQGALQIKRLFPNAVLIFILPPSWEELRQRLSAAARTPEVIEQRMANAARRWPRPGIRLRYNQRVFRDGAVRPEDGRARAAAEVRGAARNRSAPVCRARSWSEPPPGISMARITVEDCLEKIPNRFQLVLAPPTAPAC
jgi:hypothetical protein